MSKTAGVLESHQKITDTPYRRIKCSGGESLVNQGKAEWIRRKRLLRLFPEGTIQTSPRVYQSTPSPLPRTMPPAEVSGLVFEDPENAKHQSSTRRFFVLAANRFGKGQLIGNS